jgi:hypothetical protein
MKTLMRTIMLVCMLNFIITGLVLAQTPPSEASISSVPPVPSVVSSTAPALPSAKREDAALEIITVEEAAQAKLEAKRLDELLGTLGATTTTGENALTQVIPSGQINTEELLKINEDMNIMTKILEGNLEQAGINILNGIGYTSFMTSSRLKPIQRLYLQGYGALFMANVDFPLSAPPDANAQKDQTTKDNTDRVWEQTRQQIYQPQTAVISRRFNNASPSATEVQYDAQKVEKLKTTLIQSLKHASNIRVLKADESMILSITGSGISTKIIAKIQMDDGKTVVRYEANGRQIERLYNTGEWPDLSLEQTAPTVLVIRAKKADIDAFAKNELNVEQFRQLVQIISYPLLGGKTNVVTTGGSSSTSSTRGRNTTAGTSGTTTGGRTTTGTSGTTTGGRTTTATTGTATRGRTTTETFGTTSGGETTATPGSR